MEGSVYKTIELIGTSNESWEKAAKNAIWKASQTVKDLRIAEVMTQDVKIGEGLELLYRTKLRLSFRLFDED